MEQRWGWGGHSKEPSKDFSLRGEWKGKGKRRTGKLGQAERRGPGRDGGGEHVGEGSRRRTEKEIVGISAQGRMGEKRQKGLAHTGETALKGQVRT